MCLLFISFNPNSSPDGFKLILVNVRDEFCKRPTNKCDWWPNDSDIIGGIDMEPGREGGTWLAMNKNTGNIGILLNILQPVKHARTDHKSRGSLVTDFLRSSDNGKTYLEKLKTNVKEYSPFSMVTIEMNKEEQITNISSDCEAGPKVNGPGVYGFGNNGSGTPWKKLTHGNKNFLKIIEKFSSTSDKELLLESLFEMLQDDAHNLPDEQLLRQAEGLPAEAIEALSAIFVCNPKYNYGSRTNSVILIDGKNNVLFVEKTLKDGGKIGDPEWEFSKFEFQID